MGSTAVMGTEQEEHRCLLQRLQHGQGPAIPLTVRFHQESAGADPQEPHRSAEGGIASCMDSENS